MSDKCVHTEHCCLKHGCKYGDDDCPVERGAKVQSFECESCEWEKTDPTCIHIAELEAELRLRDREIENLKCINADLAISCAVTDALSAELWEAADAIREDLLMRAETDSDGMKVVSVGFGVWYKFKKALEWKW